VLGFDVLHPDLISDVAAARNPAAPRPQVYRHPILGWDVGQRCRELLRETPRAHEMMVHAGAVNRDPEGKDAIDHRVSRVGSPAMLNRRLYPKAFTRRA